MINPLKTLRNHLRMWKTLGIQKCPKCGWEVFNVVVEQRDNPRDLQELFAYDASKRAVVVCVGCKQRFYIEEFAK